MRKLTEKFVAWCNDNSPAARLERTIAQGIIGVGIGIISTMATGEGLVGMIAAPIAMAILSPVMAQIGKQETIVIKAEGTE